MKNIYILLGAGILIGFTVASSLLDFGNLRSRSSSGGDVSSKRPPSQDAPSASDTNSSLQPKSGDAPGARSLQVQPSVSSPEKVVSVREAYRQALKDEEKKPLPANVDPPASEANEASSPLPTETAAAPFAPAVGAVLPDEPVTTDQPRLWLPAAMLEPDNSISITSELQVAEWEQLQEIFVRAVDGRAPSNAAEKERWIRAQDQNDELFRAKFGWDAFQQQQLKAYREGLAPGPPR